MERKTSFIIDWNDYETPESIWERFMVDMETVVDESRPYFELDRVEFHKAEYSYCYPLAAEICDKLYFADDEWIYTYDFGSGETAIYSER